MKTKNLKILFLYPNFHMNTLVPNGIAVLSAVLKEAGFKNVTLFDPTFYKSKDEEKTWDEMAKILLQEGKELYSQMKTGESDLKNARGKIPDELLNLYDKLKLSKGFAVAKLEKEIVLRTLSFETIFMFQLFSCSNYF